jgi:hypothetical protein
MGLEFKRRGNPNWGRSSAPIANLAQPGETEFEKIVAEFKLEPEQWPTSIRLRGWVEAHKNSRYVPEDLLKAYGFAVRVDF